jgi:hypothetical protein
LLCSSRRILALAALLSGGLLGVLATRAGGTTEAFPGSSGLIAYSVLRAMPDGLYQGDICLLDPISGSTGRLTQSLEYEYLPDWSPDGGRVAYAGFDAHEDVFSSVVYVHDVATGRRVNVTGPRGADPATGTGISPSWLPGGEEIGFGWSEGILVVGADGRGRRLVSRVSGFPIFVSWAPDGRRVAYIGITDPSGTGPTSILDLSTMNAKEIDPLATFVDWSPDGNRLAQQQHGVRILDVDGRELSRVSSSEADFEAVWSPDGGEFAFERAGDIYVLAADGSGERRLTSTRGTKESNPAWQRRPFGRGPIPAFRTPCTVLGTDRAETLRGTASADFAEARRGDDLLRLGRGDDVGKGGEGNDRLFGGPGNDVLAGGVGRDRIFCGSGKDLAYAGRRDRVARDCEKVRRSR